MPFLDVHVKARGDLQSDVLVVATDDAAVKNDALCVRRIFVHEALQLEPILWP